MLSEIDRMDIRKAMAYDLLIMFREIPGKTYTCAELEKLIDAYITETQQ